MHVTARLMLVNVTASILYFGLAVLGAGGITAFLSHAPMVVTAITGIALLIVGLFSCGNVSAGEREDRGNRWVLAAFAVTGLLMAWLPAYTDRIGFWTIDGDTARWFGTLLFIGGGVLRIWPVFVLGRRFSGLVAIQPGHTLITGGIYSAIRHPSYLGLLINSVGWSLVFRSSAGLLLTATMLVPLVARIQAEEALLASQFGAEYAAYRARTSRLLPHIW